MGLEVAHLFRKVEHAYPSSFMRVEAPLPFSLTPFLKKVDVPSPLSLREARGAISIFLKRVEVAFPYLC